MTIRSYVAIVGVVAAAGISPLGTQRAGGQTITDGPILGASPVGATAALKIFSPAGSVRLVGWDKDSVVVRGHIPRGEHFTFSRDTNRTPRAITLGILDVASTETSPPCDFVVYLPRRATVSIKTVTANITANDVSGWFYSASGTVRLSGSATSIDVQSINGDLDVDVSTPWVRARTGDGHLVLRGAAQDADASTISGALDVASPALMRGQFASVTGDIHYSGSPLAGAIFDFSNHSGAVDLALLANASGVFALSSLTGPIENGFASVRPASVGPRSLRVVLGRGETGAQVAVRTFKGAIRLLRP